jgi:hypothetical protein
MANALKLTRRQLAAFLPDEETIRKFEQLIALVEQINTTTIDELQSEVGIVSQKANEALDRFFNVFGSSIKLDTSAFNALLSAADTTVQLALDTLDDHNHDGRYYTETELDAGQLDNRYYTETELDAGQLDNRYYTETETNSALALKANLASPTFTGTVSGITSTMVGLGNVDDTSDLNKPVSTATQTALNLKANIASPAFTGNVSTSGDSIRIDTAKTPSSAADTGTTGQIAWDSSYIYVCTATDTWKRSAIATW